MCFPNSGVMESLSWCRCPSPAVSSYSFSAETCYSTHVFVKTPPIEQPMSRQSCWEKNTQVISCNVEPVWHFRSRIVGPRKAMLSPKLKNTLQYVSVCWQFLLKSVTIRSSINIAWKSPTYSPHSCSSWSPGVWMFLSMGFRLFV